MCRAYNKLMQNVYNAEYLFKETMTTTDGASSPSARLNTPETSPDTQQSETSQVVHTLAEINRNMNKMSNVLDDIWQQSQDKHSPLQ